MSLDLAAVIAPALDAYSAEIARHGADDVRPAGEFYLEGTCRCGWSTRKPRRALVNRAVGMHVAAAERRASRAYDAECSRLIAAAMEPVAVSR